MASAPPSSADAAGAALAPALIRPAPAADPPAPVSPPAPAKVLRRARVRRSTWAGVGLVMLYLSIIVLIPLAAVFWHAAQLGPAAFWKVVTTSDTLAALELSLGAALIVAVVNATVGTVIAWVLVRDEFPGKTIVNAFIDLPFALPTIVAGLTLLALYGPKSPFGVNLAYTRGAVLLALLFVTLPFVVRSVQPVLMELERDAEEAASSLGARGFTVFRRIVLPSLLPAIVSGAGLSFARAIGEFGSVVLISGNIPFKTQIAPVRIFGLVESGDSGGAAAVSVVLLLISFGVLLVLTLVQAWGRSTDELD